MPDKIGPYTVVSQLGRGGMGVVYKCRDEALNRFVAIKVLTENLTDDATFLQRFVREAQAAASLSHPNVVQIYFIGEDELGHPYFVMEYVSGRSLDHILRSEQRIDDPRATQLMLQAAHGLAAAHDLGIIHRDIKPANLMLDDRGIVKIADFGLALPADAENRLTATGMFVGTPGYISPEQCAGEKADHRTDIYALGVTYYMLLTGTPPFRGESPLALMKQILDANPPDVTTINPNINPESRRILAKMIAKEREERYQNCHELVTDLENLLSTMGVRSMTAGLATRTPTASASSPEALAAMSAPTAIVAGGASSPAAAPLSEAPTVIPAPPRAAVTQPDMPFVAPPTNPAPQAAAVPQVPVRRKGLSTRTIVVAALLVVLLLGGGAVAAVMYGTKIFKGFLSAPVQADATTDAATAPVKNPPQEALLSQSITPSTLLTSNTQSDVAPAGASGAAPADADSPQQSAAEPSRGPASQPVAQSSAQSPAREAAPTRVVTPAREPQRRALSGVAVAAIGDEALLGAVSSVLRNEAEAAGLEAVDAHSLPSTEDMLRGRAALRDLIAELRSEGYAVLMLARIDPTGQREVSYYGRTDTVYNARITVTPYDLATGRPFGSPQTGEIRYSSININSESQDVVTPLARKVAEAIRGR